MRYKVTYDITGKNYNTGEENDRMTVEADVEFTENPEDYGNGFYMGIKSPVEPFGHQGYDIRYDKRFRRDNIPLFLVEFFTDRYDGKDGAWKLKGISVSEEE